MALSPIQIYQQQQNPLAQILAGGNQAITGIFDRAIQIGRDMSNKQLQQEQDMAAMRARETAMGQRRAEDLQQNNEDAIRFARGAFESDRKFGVDQQQQAFQNTRATANDLFSQGQSEARLGLAENADKRAEEDQKLRFGVAEEQKKLRQANASYYSGQYGNQSKSEQSISPANLFYDPTMENKSPASERPTGSSEISANGLYAEEERLKSDLASSPKDPALRSRIAAQLGAVKEKIKALPTPDKPPTERQKASDARAESDQAAQELTRADKAMEEKVLGNTTAFMPQGVVLQKRQADSEKYKDTTKAPTGAEIAEAKVYDSNRYISEKASARRMTLSEYLSKGPQDEASKKAREELWNHVNGVPTTASPRPSGNPAEDTLNTLLHP